MFVFSRFFCPLFLCRALHGGLLFYGPLLFDLLLRACRFVPDRLKRRFPARYYRLRNDFLVGGGYPLLADDLFLDLRRFHGFVPGLRVFSLQSGRIPSLVAADEKSSGSPLGPEREEGPGCWILPNSALENVQELDLRIGSRLTAASAEVPLVH